MTTNNACLEVLDEAARMAKPKTFREHKWGKLHHDAWFAPRGGFEMAFVVTLKGLATMADAHHRAYGSHLGEDGVCGRYWLDTLVAFMRLRDGEHGRFDSGELGDAARALAIAAGFDKEECEEIP